MKNDDNNDEKCCIESDFKNMKERTIYENNERITEHLNRENLFSTNDKGLIDIIINKMKNEGNANVLYQLIEEQNCVCVSVCIVVYASNK